METKWIVACGARRSGSTLHYQLAKEVVVLGDGFQLGWTTWQDFDRHFREHDGKHPYVIIKCHVHMPSNSLECRKLWNANRAYGVFVHRNMYDTMVSMQRLNRLNGVPDDVLLRDVVATVKESISWLNTPNVLVTAYDDIMNEAGKALECARIADHIGVEITSDQCTSIARDHAMEVQRARLPKIGVGQDGLWANHIDAGATGAWKKKLTAAQIEFCRAKSSQLHKRLGYVL